MMTKRKQCILDSHSLAKAIVEANLDGNVLWSPPPPDEPTLSPDDPLFAVWLMRTRGDPTWNPDRTDHTIGDWWDEMGRLITVYQRSRRMDDARRAAIHHAKIMHRHMLDLSYGASVGRDVETFIWWMAHREGWLDQSSAVA